MANRIDLGKQLLFEGVEATQLQKIAGKLSVIILNKDHYLFREDEEAKGIYLVDSGKLEISKTTPDGWKQSITVFKAGSFCGELAVLEKRRHAASAIALEDSKLFLLSRDEFERLQSEDTSLANVILRKLCIILSCNLRSMNDRLLKTLVGY